MGIVVFIGIVCSIESPFHLTARPRHNSHLLLNHTPKTRRQLSSSPKPLTTEQTQARSPSPITLYTIDNDGKERIIGEGLSPAQILNRAALIAAAEDQEQDIAPV